MKPKCVLSPTIATAMLSREAGPELQHCLALHAEFFGTWVPQIQSAVARGQSFCQIHVGTVSGAFRAFPDLESDDKAAFAEIVRRIKGFLGRSGMHVQAVPLYLKNQLTSVVVTLSWA